MFARTAAAHWWLCAACAARNLSATDDCTMHTLVSPQDPLVFQHDPNARTLRWIGAAESAAQPASLPTAVSLAHFGDAGCGGCLKDVFVELDVEVRVLLPWCAACGGGVQARLRVVD